MNQAATPLDGSKGASISALADQEEVRLICDTQDEPAKIGTTNPQTLREYLNNAKEICSSDFLEAASEMWKLVVNPQSTYLISVYL